MKKTVFGILVAVMVTVACGPTPQEQGYQQVCKDKDGVIVETSKCQNNVASGLSNGELFMLWWLLTPSGQSNYYRPGMHVPMGQGYATQQMAQSAYAATRTYSAPATSSATSGVSTGSVSRPNSGGWFRGSTSTSRSSATTTSRPYSGGSFSSPSRSYSSPSRSYSSPSRSYSGGSFRGGRR